MGKRTCIKCGKTMDELAKFYKARNGVCEDMCKSCQTMHIDNFNPDTFLWLLEKLDFPYVEEKWSSIRTREYEKDPSKFNGMSVIGKYLGSMRLGQWQGKGWDYTFKRGEEEQARIEQVKKDNEEYIKQLDADFEAGKISKAQYDTLMPVEEKNTKAMNAPILNPIGANNFFNEKDFVAEDEMPDPAAELSKEDKIALAMKWGRTYKASECLTLEQDYRRMKKSFTINDADSENTLQLLCKTRLKLDQAIDMGDFDTYLKLSKVYEAMRKSAKFTAAQNKENKGGAFDALGQIVALCEKETGFIPKDEFKIEYDFDIIDTVLNDMKSFNLSLIKEDPTVFKQIESYIKKREIVDSMNEMEEKNAELTDEDYNNYYDDVHQQIEADKKILEEMMEEEEDE